MPKVLDFLLILKMLIAMFFISFLSSKMLIEVLDFLLIYKHVYYLQVGIPPVHSIFYPCILSPNKEGKGSTKSLPSIHSSVAF